MLRFDPFSPAIDADPFPAYKELRDAEPCFWSEDAEMWVLSRYGDILARPQRLADLFVGQGQPDDGAARPRRRHARHPAIRRVTTGCGR